MRTAQVQQGLALLQDRTQALEQTTQDPAQAAAVQELKTDAQQLRQELHARASDTKSVDCRLDALEGDAVVQEDLREQLDDLDIDLKKLLEQKTGTLDERVRVLELNRADYMHAAMGEDMHGRLGQARTALQAVPLQYVTMHLFFCCILPALQACSSLAPGCAHGLMPASASA